MDNTRKIVITGATGAQGGSVFRHLRGSNWRLVAVTRNPDKPEAQQLKGPNVEVVQANLDDRNALDSLFRGAYGVFSVQQFWEHGYDAEVRQGKNVADAAKAAGVKHLLYNSVGSADANTGISHFDSKYLIEKHIRSLGIPATILRPVFFMENFKFFAPPKVVDGIYIFNLPLPSTQKLQMLAVDDIGGFARLVFDHPESYIGKDLDLAGDELTMQQIVETFSRVTGKQSRFEEQPIEQVRGFSEDAAVMYEWFIKEGYRANIPALRKIYPELHTFEMWLKTQTW